MGDTTIVESITVETVVSVEKVIEIVSEVATVSVNKFDALTDTPASKVGHTGKVLMVNANENALEYSTPRGAGDVIGPAGTTDGGFAIFDGTTGKLIKDGGILIDGGTW